MFGAGLDRDLPGALGAGRARDDAHPAHRSDRWQGFAAKLIARILLLPVISGLSYELIRFAAKRQGSVMAALTAPGLWMQRITTKQPSNDQAEVAIHALDGAMTLEKSQGGELVIA